MPDPGCRDWRSWLSRLKLLMRLSRDGKVAKVETKSPTAVAVKDPETTVRSEPSRMVSAVRNRAKRLFVEGEGWIVRKVTTCY